jgi:hypothetical protein
MFILNSIYLLLIVIEYLFLNYHIKIPSYFFIIILCTLHYIYSKKYKNYIILIGWITYLIATIFVRFNFLTSFLHLERIFVWTFVNLLFVGIVVLIGFSFILMKPFFYYKTKYGFANIIIGCSIIIIILLSTYFSFHYGSFSLKKIFIT